MPALSDPFPLIGVPGTAFFNDARLDTNIQEISRCRNAFAIEYIEFRLPEWRGQLVFYNLDLGAVPQLFLSILDRGGAANIKPDRCIKFQCIATGRGFRISKNNADFGTNLVDENHTCHGLADGSGQFSQGLGHEPGLKPHVGIPHVAFDFRTGNQRRHRVDDHDINGSASHQHIGDFKGLLPGIGLRNQHFITIDSELACINRVQRMFGVNKCGDSTLTLGACNRMKGQRSFPR